MTIYIFKSKFKNKFNRERERKIIKFYWEKNV